MLLFAQDRARWTAPFNRYLFRTQAGDDGLFKVSTLPPGDYYAIALDHADPAQLAGSGVSGDSGQAGLDRLAATR